MKINVVCPICNSDLTLEAPDTEIVGYINRLSNIKKTLICNSLIDKASELAAHFSLLEKTEPLISPLVVVQDNYDSLGIVDRYYEWAFVTEKLYENKTLNNRILDVGSALTALPSIMASMGNEVVSVDIQKWEMPWKGVITVQLDLLCDIIPYPDNYFDYVVCISAIEHFGLGRYVDIASPDGDFEGMRAIINALKPGGGLILTFPVGLPAIVYPAHRIYGPKRVERLIQGFTIEDKRFFNAKKDIPLARFECTEEEAFQAEPRHYSIGCYFLRNSK